MNKLFAAGAFVLAFSPMVAFAGEGNGPDFPGLQIPNIAITAGTQPGSSARVTDRMSHRADAGYEPANAFASKDTPDGIVQPGSSIGAAVARHRLAMAALTQR